LVTASGDGREYVTPRSRAEWRRWLARHQRRPTAIWLIYYKKKNRLRSVSYDDVVEECLCFGSIDSQVRKLDADRYCQLITPRKPKSAWSKLNKTRIASLEAAQADGTWTALDAAEALNTPADLRRALRANSAAKRRHGAFSRSTRKYILT
jgi:uncharacterized protein YdeI (YjbR/CyaY-like superfamily)